MKKATKARGSDALSFANTDPTPKVRGLIFPTIRGEVGSSKPGRCQLLIPVVFQSVSGGTGWVDGYPSCGLRGEVGETARVRSGVYHRIAQREHVHVWGNFLNFLIEFHR